MRIAFDFGLKRIASPQATRSPAPRVPVPLSSSGLTARLGRDRFRSAGASPGLLVVGAPYNVDDSPGALAPAASAFAAELQRRFGLPVKRIDERFSSLEASARLKSQRAAGQRRRIRREHIDSAAAAVILERWLAGEGQRK